MKVMETVNVVIDESLESDSDKFGEEIPKEILPPEPKEVQEIVEQEPVSRNTPDTLSVVEDSAKLSTSPDSETYKEKGPSSRIKLNHPLEVIVGNMNEFTLKKRTVDKCVANFVLFFVRTYVFHLLRTYVMILCNWLIFSQNALYLYLGRFKMF